MQRDIIVWLANGGFGTRDILKLKAFFEDLSEVITAPASRLKAAGLSEKKCSQLLDYRQTISSSRVNEQLAELKIQTIVAGDSTYPSRLAEIPSAPIVLFIRGSIDCLNQPSLAVVGTRKPSQYGRRVTEKLVTELVASGLAIVSGLAYGIDALAHQVALDAGGKTVAILGNGIDQIQPRAHIQLGKRIIDNGAILSEYPPGYPALRQHFPARNRLVAGLSLGTLVIEGAKNSGSLITAQFAQEYGRHLFAIPGQLDNPMSYGPHELIQHGAYLITSAANVLDHLPTHMLEQTSFLNQTYRPVNNQEQSIYELLKVGPQSIDSLSRQTGMSVPQVTITLTMLELSGVVRISGESVSLA